MSASLRWQRVLNHKGPAALDLGLAPRGTLRPLLGDFSDAGKNPVLAVFWSHDRTLKEWIELITEYRNSAYVWPAFLPIPKDPLFNRWTQGVEIEQLFLKNQRMRWIVRKFIARIRQRIMDKRVVGETDLYTTLPIPDTQAIRIYDVKTRSVYRFHMLTMQRLMSGSLLYSSYAIASPQTPLNPYTNIPWHTGQLISIVSQMLTVGARICRMPPLLLTDYRMSNFDTKTFFANHMSFLHTQAAISFFDNLDDSDAQEMFVETYDDLVSYANDTIYPHRVQQIRRLLKGLKKGDLLKRWKDVITSFWIFYNHKFMWKWDTIDDLLYAYQRLQRDTAVSCLLTPPIINVRVLIDGV